MNDLIDLNEIAAALKLRREYVRDRPVSKASDRGEGLMPRCGECGGSGDAL